MKKLTFLLLMFVSTAWAYILPLDKILEQMGKNTINGPKLQLWEKRIANDQSDLFMAGVFRKKVSKDEIKKYLTNIDVDLKKISLGLHNHEPVLIIGADPSDNNSPQVWVSKNNFFPVKELVKNRVTTFKWTDNIPTEIHTTMDGVKTAIILPKD